MQKLETRKAALERSTTIATDKKAKWREILIGSLISSEESGEEEVDGNLQLVLYVKSLPWRAGKATRFFKQLDDKNKRTLSKRAKQQTLLRKPGEVSDRSKSIEFSSNFWGFD